MKLRGKYARRKTKIERYNKHFARLLQNNDEYLSMFRRVKHKSEHIAFPRGSGKTSPLIIMLTMGQIVYSSKYLGRNWRKKRRLAR